MKHLLLLFTTAWLTVAGAAEPDKARIVLAPGGLPEQITIQAHPSELPLEVRAQKEIPAAILQAIGRGDQLRAPARLVVRAAGQEIVATLTGEDWKAGETTLKVKTTATPGRLDFAVTYSGGSIESLALVLDLAGPVDTIVAGTPPAAFTPTLRDGVIWANTTNQLAGLMPRCFVGSGDRGFTWLAPDAKGFEVGNTAPTQQLDRDKAGNVTWRCFLVNRPTKLDKPRTANFSLLIEPTQTKPATARRQTWLTPAADGLTADAQPLLLHRFLAGTHAGRVTQFRLATAQPPRAGGDPAADRQALGRALLLDQGLDCTGLANLTEGLTVVKALEEFGALKDDGQTEFRPYWRTAGVIRYGEAFSNDDVFTLTAEDPVAAVRLSVWRRGKQTLIVVVNESDKPVREQLYVLDPAKIFGGPNQTFAMQIAAGWDTTAIPADSDWSKSRLQSSVPQPGGSAGICLRDVTDQGFVKSAAIKGGVEVYGPVYVAPHSYRVLLGGGP